jgi:cytosine/uracil/thiamine/allantoin permease
MRPSGLFWLWSGAVFNVEYLFYGTLIMTFGLTVSQAILVIIVANVFYGIVVGAGVYWALAARRVRREAAQTAAA